MNALNFWFYFVLFGAGCGIGLLIETIIMLIIKAVRNRPKRKMISSVGMTWDDFEKELSYKQITKGITAERLSEICTAEKEGRCVVLPWKVGDTVYEPYPDGIDQAGVDKIIIEISTKIGIYEISDVGKTVFLTKEQAEAKLVEMKESERA